MCELEFQEKEHVYKVNGKQKPSSTEIIGEYIKVKIGDGNYYVQKHTGTVIRSYVFERAGFIGTNFHTAVKYYIEGRLDYNSLVVRFGDEEIGLQSMFQQFLSWYRKYKPEILLIEKPLYSKRHDFCGTPDLFCKIKIGKKIYYILLDVKTGLYGMVGPQLASYEILIRENLKFRKIIDTYVLHIPKDGLDYDFHEVKDKDAKQEFHSLHFDYKYKRRAA